MHANAARYESAESASGDWIPTKLYLQLALQDQRLKLQLGSLC